MTEIGFKRVKMKKFVKKGGLNSALLKFVGIDVEEEQESDSFIVSVVVSDKVSQEIKEFVKKNKEAIISSCASIDGAVIHEDIETDRVHEFVSSGMSVEMLLDTSKLKDNIKLRWIYFERRIYSFRS